MNGRRHPTPPHAVAERSGARRRRGFWQRGRRSRGGAALCHGVGAAPLFIRLLVVLFVTGCGSKAPLPTFPAMDAQTTLRTLSRRAAAVRTVSSECFLTLTRPDGQSVRLDGAMAMRVPTDVRLQAFKFNQKVFDLTLTPQGLWTETPDDPQRKRQVLPASISAGHLARGLSLFSGDVFTGSDVQVLEPNESTLEVRKPVDGQQTMTAIVDRATLTVREYRLTDPRGRVRFTLSCADYRDLGGVVWPMRLVAVSESGRIEVELSDVTINGELPLTAFVPPRRALRVS